MGERGGVLGEQREKAIDTAGYASNRDVWLRERGWNVL